MNSLKVLLSDVSTDPLNLFIKFQKLVEEDESIPWSCLICKIKSNAEIFPFGLLSKLELLDLYGIDLPCHLETVPSFETCSKLVNLPNLNDFGIDENVINAVNLKYYSITEFIIYVEHTCLTDHQSQLWI